LNPCPEKPHAIRNLWVPRMDVDHEVMIGVTV
jgi:hypothetical protein